MTWSRGLLGHVGCRVTWTGGSHGRRDAVSRRRRVRTRPRGRGLRAGTRDRARATGHGGAHTDDDGQRTTTRPRAGERKNAGGRVACARLDKRAGTTGGAGAWSRQTGRGGARSGGASGTRTSERQVQTREGRAIGRPRRAIRELARAGVPGSPWTAADSGAPFLRQPRALRGATLRPPSALLWAGGGATAHDTATPAA